MPFGVGMGLTLDESALLLELDDVYWTPRGHRQRADHARGDRDARPRLRSACASCAAASRSCSTRASDSAWPCRGYAVKRSVGRCIGFSALSFGSWLFYWLYTNRRLLDSELGRGRDDAVLHTVGYLVPVLNIFVVYWLWRDLSELRVRSACRTSSWRVHGRAIFLAPVFSAGRPLMNEYWDVRLQGWAHEAP